ncbi:uncharacterized protein RBU33_011581 isoform 4-T4 [Hipposideros larvatus]
MDVVCGCIKDRLRFLKRKSKFLQTSNYNASHDYKLYYMQIMEMECMNLGLRDTEDTPTRLPVTTKEANTVFRVDLKTRSSHLRSARVRVP